VESNILTLNAGSSSLKYAVFRWVGSDLEVTLRGAISGIGTEHPRWKAIANGSEAENAVDPRVNHESAFRLIAERLDAPLCGVGHRIVHGGTRFHGPALIDDDVRRRIEELIPLAPLHQPAQVRLIEAVAGQFPDLPQVACFDTSIHHTLAEVIARFPIADWAFEAGVRRYGFHGLSYESVLWSHPELQSGRTLIAHLGNGVSATAFLDGRSVDTTMGLTPAGGMMMGTRCGDIDPGVLLHLMRERDLSADDLDRLVNGESGLLGVSCITSDMQALLNSSDPKSDLAVDMFCLLAAKYLAGLAVSLSGVDHLVFTGGIGENAPVIRERISDRLAILGVVLDAAANRAGGGVISRPESRVETRVVAADEEQQIARHTAALLGQPGDRRGGAVPDSHG